RVHTLAGQHHADRAVELVHRAVGDHARRVLGHARTVAEAGAAVVPRTGVDPGEAVAHVSAWREHRAATGATAGSPAHAPPRLAPRRGRCRLGTAGTSRRECRTTRRSCAA